MRVQKVLELKQKKLERDATISTTIASTRDKINWMIAVRLSLFGLFGSESKRLIE